VTDAKGVAKEVEVWHEKNAVKRLEAVRLRGALLDAGVHTHTHTHTHI
jgi:hypothetical protein